MRVKSLTAWWLDVPPLASTEPALVRMRAVLLRVGPASLAIHVIYSAVFAALGAFGAWPLVWFNVFVSVPLWALTLVALRRGSLQTAVITSQLEVVAHTVFATLVVGWESGFHAYAFIPFATIGSAGRGQLRRPARTVGLLALATWLVLFVVLRRAQPWATLPPVALSTFQCINFVSCFGIVAQVIWGTTEVADSAELSLAREHARSETLLQNILPTAIATRLKNGEVTIADGYETASVLFADIVGFTGLSARTTPARLVETLNEIFSRIDALAGKYGLEKIKTIGDAYMVASGVPTPRADHAAALADFAIELVKVVDEYQAEGGVQLRMRVGLHSGPVVAGVIGKRKFAYDLWGDAVNTASRMESHGAPGRVHVSAESRALLAADFDLEPRGTIEVKGKGPMETFFLVRRSRSAAATAP